MDIVQTSRSCHALDQAASALTALQAARTVRDILAHSFLFQRALTSAFAALIRVPGLKYWIANPLRTRACAPSTIGNSRRFYSSPGKRLHRQSELRQPAAKARQEAAKIFSWKFPSCFRQYSRCPRY
jgi:hypothetical protein